MANRATGAASEQTAAIAAVEAEAEQAQQRAAKLALTWFDAQQMTSPRWITGEPLPPVVLLYVLQCQARTKAVTVEKRAGEIVALIDKPTSAAFARALLHGWLNQGANAKESWCLPLVAVLADAQIVPVLRRQIDSWVKSARGAMAAKATAALALVEGEQAYTELDSIATQIKQNQVKRAAQKALLEIANRLNISTEELSDRVTPRLGFDEQGQRIFDFGPRHFTARLRLDRTLALSDSAGKHLTALPKPGTHDDAEKAAAALAAWKLLKTQLGQAVKAQAQRLESAMIAQRRWSADSWQTLFLHHPLLRSFAVTLVWGVLSPESNSIQTIFRPLEDATLTNTNDEQIALPAAGVVRLLHPIELDEQTLAAWTQHLSDYEIVQPFAQLQRPIHRVSAQERTATTFDKYEGYVLGGGAFKGRFQKANWQRGSIEDAGIYDEIWKVFPEEGIEAMLSFSGAPVGYENMWTLALKSLLFIKDASIKHGGHVVYTVKNDQRIMQLGDVPPLIYSEIIAEVQAFAASGQYDENWKDKVN
jgi:hypothetical protein